MSISLFFFSFLITFLYLLVSLIAMTNFNTTPEFIFSASERELLTLTLAEIIDGIICDYKSFSKGIEEGIKIPEKKQEPRLMHSCILYAEGLRLAHTHPELAKKLIFASLFNASNRALDWLRANGEASKVIALLREIVKFEKWKKDERKRREEEDKAKR